MSKRYPHRQKPPAWATAILTWYCRPELLEDLQGDLHECFERNCKVKSQAAAKLIYIIDVFKFLRPYTMRKISFFNVLIQWMMIGSYVKTSGRSLVRNKLFSIINIAGLAVSMSVGLLMVSLTSDFLSYDDFHENRDRIYRVNSKIPVQNNNTMELATTSYKTGKDLLETGSGFDAVTIIGNGFGGDAKIGDKKIPIGGHWASSSFFTVFSFPLLHGNPATALKDPYSLVLSEKTALKLFGTTDVVGKSVGMDTLNYVVTGVMKDFPRFSHIHSDVLASISTKEALYPKSDPDMLSWQNQYGNYVYVLAKNGNTSELGASLAKISNTENKLEGKAISLYLRPLTRIVFNKVGNQIGPVFPLLAIWIMAGLALVVILSACFNYTNLSIARSIRRGREVGIRKVIGAGKSHVLGQFMAESVILSLMALIVSFGLFLFLRKQFLNLNPMIGDLVSLELSPVLILRFLGMTFLVGIAAGFLPALFFSRVNAVQALKDVSSIKVFKSLSLRKALVVVQYSFSLIFISTTLIGYHQYSSFISFDLGYKTANILNVSMQGNSNAVFKKYVSELPGVKGVSVSRMVTSVGSIYSTQFTYNNNRDTGNVSLNAVDEHYFALHEQKILAGRNFNGISANQHDGEVIVTKKFVEEFNIGNRDPWKAVGQVISVENKPRTIIGVIPDFHYGTVEDKIMSTMFFYSADETWGYLNLAVESADLPSTMQEIDDAWKKTDDIHPIEAKFYDDQIQHSYGQFIVMVKVIGFLSFLAICIASMGLFGMVVFTTETRLREISIRKVLGASETNLIYLLSRGFIGLLVLSAVISLPLTYLFFDRVVLIHFYYHDPIRLSDMLLGFAGVSIIAMLMIGSQTLKAAQSNPADVLKSE